MLSLGCGVCALANVTPDLADHRSRAEPYASDFASDFAYSQLREPLSGSPSF